MTRQIISKVLCLALATSVMTTVNIDTAAAQRKTLLEQWFPKAAQRIKQRQLQDFGRLGQFDGDPEPIKKISGPSYYTYKTEGLKSINLAGKLPKPEIDASQSTDNLNTNASEQDEVSIVAENKETPLIETVSEVLDNSEPNDGTDSVVATEDVKVSEIVSVKVNKPQFTLAALEGWQMDVEAEIADAIEDHYAKNPDYLWVGLDQKPNFWADGVISLLQSAEEYGLDPRDYAVDRSNLVNADPANAERAAAQFELELSAAALRYAGDAQSGRINPNRISGYHDFPEYKRDYQAYMKQIADSMDPAQSLEQLNPGNVRFAALKRELADLRVAAKENDIEPVAPGTFFKPGQTNSELPKVIAAIERKASVELKTRHQQTLAAYSGSEVFDDPLVAIVRDFQEESGLGADGIVGKNTIAKLQLASPLAKIHKVEIAMEQLRWLPADFGKRHVFINQPAYTASYIVNDKAQLSMRAIVGLPSNQTSFFYDTIEVVEVNPYWNVPKSILQNEMLGKIRTDPGYLTARNYEVVSANGTPQDPYTVDWYSASGPQNVRVRQRPGSSNALGELKILFPNKHAIYMHDTPSRNLFQRTSRALSHGCIRLQKPRDMAAAVLQTSAEQVGSYIAGGQNKTIKVENQLPVYVSYFTAWPEDDGSVDYFADIYGRDAAVTKAFEATSALRERIIAAAS